MKSNGIVQSRTGTWWNTLVLSTDGHKNGDHRQSKRQKRNRRKPHLCSNLAWLEVAARFLDLRGSDILDEPILIYRDDNGVIKNLTSNVATFWIRSAAKEAHCITDPAKLDMFTTDLWRIGACYLLFS